MHAAHVTIKQLWRTVHNCGVLLFNRMAARIYCVCACFVDAVLGHILCMKRKNGFMDGCKYECVHSNVA
jgi:hypothetical protein